MLSIAPMRCWMKEVITTWWKFGPAIAGCIALGGAARRKSKLNDSLVDLAAVGNRQSVHLGGDVSRVRYGSRGYPKRGTRASAAARGENRCHGGHSVAAHNSLRGSGGLAHERLPNSA